MSTSSEDNIVIGSAAAKETPGQRFRRVATRRTRQILKHLRLLGNTANQNYKHTQEEVDAIFAALRKALADTEAKFSTLHEEGFEL
jgi:hypothetical protein